MEVVLLAYSQPGVEDVRAAYCASHRYSGRIERLLTRDDAVQIFHVWERFELAIPNARSGVALIEWLSASTEFLCLRNVKRHLPKTPVILITRRDNDNLRAMKYLAFNEIVWIDE